MDETSFNKIVEGSTTILYPKSDTEAFYNPVQEFNRDLTIAVINQWADIFKDEQITRRKRDFTNKQLLILEALSATGLRAIRFAKELNFDCKIVANDMSEDAIAAIKRNIDHNEVGTKVQPNLGNAITVLQDSSTAGGIGVPDVIDLDPYGTAIPFLDAAIGAINPDGGLLCVTCTDMAVLAGPYPDVCMSKYSGVPVRGAYGHEQALRLILNSLQTFAARKKRYIVPLISMSIDFYARIFVRVYSGAKQANEIASKTAMVHQCTKCPAFGLSHLGSMGPSKSGKGSKFNFGRLNNNVIGAGGKCRICDSAMHFGGPIYTGELHSSKFIDGLLKGLTDAKLGTLNRIRGMLSICKEELPDFPFYYRPGDLSKLYKISTMPQKQFVSAILNAGYRWSSTHCVAGAIKTDAPIDFLLKCNQQNVENNKAGQSNYKVTLNIDCDKEINFTFHQGSIPQVLEEKAVRFQENPAPNWGPGSRNKRKRFGIEEDIE